MISASALFASSFPLLRLFVFFFFSSEHLSRVFSVWLFLCSFPPVQETRTPQRLTSAPTPATSQTSLSTGGSIHTLSLLLLLLTALLLPPRLLLVFFPGTSSSSTNFIPAPSLHPLKTRRKKEKKNKPLGDLLAFRLHAYLRTYSHVARLQTERYVWVGCFSLRTEARTPVSVMSATSACAAGLAERGDQSGLEEFPVRNIAHSFRLFLFLFAYACLEIFASVFTFLRLSSSTCLSTSFLRPSIPKVSQPLFLSLCGTQQTHVFCRIPSVLLRSSEEL